MLGSCDCLHLLDVRYQLKPCQFVTLMFKQGNIIVPNDMLLFNYFIDGFPVVDDMSIQLYECDNYQSILSMECKSAMDKIVKKESIF